MLKILTGPTAVGKSGVAVQIARQVGAEIVSADSMQIYRGMDIGTAKPSLETRREIPHHLIDILDPWEAYSVGRYVQDAAEIVLGLESEGKESLVVGGTALYIKALTEGLFKGPEADWGIRQELEGVAREKGVHYLHGVLAEVDPASAQQIQKGDLRRVVRALEVYQKTGHPISSLQQEWGMRHSNAEFGIRSSGFNSAIRNPHSTSRMVILSLDRRELYQRIEERVERMFQEGLVEEVRRLTAHPLGLGRQAREALGYAEVIEYLGGKMTLSETKELTKRNTRRFAKRQMTWFRSFTGAVWLEIKEDGSEEAAKRAMEILYP
ncbi:MAG TPA: tRNA (adenosine(37)-N6)-dimethylallyltransferase MiaA [Candidatus Tripitaka sp. YC43]